MDRQTERNEELTLQVTAAADAEGRLQAVLASQQEMVLGEESSAQGRGYIDQVAFQLKRQQAAKERELEVCFKELYDRTRAACRAEQDALQSKLRSIQQDLAATRVETSRLRSQQAAVSIHTRQCLDGGKAALATLGGTVSARFSQVGDEARTKAAKAEDVLHRLQMQLASSKEAAACELESMGRRGLALKVEAEAMSDKAAEETAQLATELSAVETQRSMISRNLSDEAGALVSALRDGFAQGASLQVEVGELRAEVERLLEAECVHFTPFFRDTTPPPITLNVYTFWGQLSSQGLEAELRAVAQERH